MRVARQKLFEQLDAALTDYIANERELQGLDATENRVVFIDQVVDSIRRVEFARKLGSRPISKSRTDPKSDLFDPLRAAVWHRVNGNIEEASWLVFLATHFGKNLESNWRLAQDVYGALGQDLWTWDRVYSDPEGISRWLKSNFHSMRTDGIARKFGNHRKYESIDPSKSIATGLVVESYVAWVAQYGSHQAMFDAAYRAAGGDKRVAFNWLYKDMNVLRFGRMAKFDYLTMLAKLGVIHIEADSPYIVNSTGPLRGAKLLVSGHTHSDMTPHEVDAEVVKLADSLGVGMQEIEDAICNWQKSPSRYKHFRG
ncbi:alpha-glutamyl/putrescinyl thymine pyrophosphorylase clade 3 protein [Marinobacter alexandrii]|uniref:alpha-glutamyl/putrescinyl thymine pyrophosphorylase clade 3 protein n=1 Tax=Marinobacter alexandrii TaxID=2570351 RepID=UPI001109FC4C|nr:hypothetical protein [Marinobacter alexandrii]